MEMNDIWNGPVPRDFRQNKLPIYTTSCRNIKVQQIDLVARYGKRKARHRVAKTNARAKMLRCPRVVSGTAWIASSGRRVKCLDD